MKPAPPVTSSRRYGSPPVTRPASRRVVSGARPHRRRSRSRRRAEAGHGAGVGPVTLVDPGEQVALGDVVVEHVGHLELAAPEGARWSMTSNTTAQEVHADGDQDPTGCSGFSSKPMTLPAASSSATPTRCGSGTRSSVPAPGRRARTLGDLLEHQATQDVVAETTQNASSPTQVPQPDGVRDAGAAALRRGTSRSRPSRSPSASSCPRSRRRSCRRR